MMHALGILTTSCIGIDITQACTVIATIHHLTTMNNECCKRVLANASRHVFAFAQKY